MTKLGQNGYGRCCGCCVVIVVCCCGCCCCGYYFIIVSVSLSKSMIFKHRRGLLLMMPDAAPAAGLLSRTINPRLGTVPSCSPRGCQRRQCTPQTATAGSPPGPSSEMCKDGAATTRNPRALPQDRADQQPKTTSPRGTRRRSPRTGSNSSEGGKASTCTCKRQHQRLNSHRQTQTAGRREGTRQLRGRRRRYRQLFLQQAIALVVAPKLPHRGRLSLSVRSSFCCNNVGAFNGSAPSSCSSSCPSSSSPLTLPRRQASPSLPCQPFPRRPRSAPR